MATTIELFAEANYFFASKQYDKARTVYQKAVEESDAGTSLLFSEGSQLFDQGDYEHALFIFSLLLEIEESTEVLYYIGYCHLRLGKYSVATETFKKSVQLEPEYAKGYAGWGDSLWKQKKNTEALEKYKISLSKALSPSLAEKVLLGIGNDLQHYQDVLDILANRPDLVTPLARETLTAGMELGLQQYDKAAEAYERAVLLDPSLAKRLQAVYANLLKTSNAPAYLSATLAAIEQHVDEFEKEVARLAALPAATLVDTNSVTTQLVAARQKAGRIAYWLGKYWFDYYERIDKQIDFDMAEAMDEVWEHWRKTIQYAPDSEQTKEMGDMLFNKYQWEKATETYEAYRIEYEPQSAEYAYGTALLGATAFYQFQNDKARQLLQEAAAIQSIHRYYALYMLGSMAYTEGMARKPEQAKPSFTEAEKYFRQAFVLAPDQFFVIEGLVSFLSSRSQKADALAICRKAMITYVKSDSDDADQKKRRANIAYLKGNVYLDMRETDEAISCYEEAVENDTAYIYALHNLGHSLEKKGKYKAALKAWNTVKKLYEQAIH